MSTFVLEAISEGYSQGGTSSKRIYGRGERIAYKDIYHRPVYSRGIRMKGRKGENWTIMFRSTSPKVSYSPVELFVL